MTEQLRNLPIAVLGTLLMMISNAAASTSPLPVEPASTNSECATSSLTQNQFIDMVHAISMHGNLDDVAFTESTLQSKIVAKTIKTGWLRILVGSKSFDDCKPLTKNRFESRFGGAFSDDGEGTTFDPQTGEVDGGLIDGAHQYLYKIGKAKKTIEVSFMCFPPDNFIGIINIKEISDSNKE